MLAGLLLAAGPALPEPAPAPARPAYRVPVPVLARFLEQPLLPLAVAQPQGRFVLLVHRQRLAPLRELAAREAGRARAAPRHTGLTVVSAPAGDSRRLPLPPDARVGFPAWSPDGNAFAFPLSRGGGVELWIGDPVAASARPLASGLSYALGAPCRWMPDARRLLCRLALAPDQDGRKRTRVPAGPLVWDSADTAPDLAGAPARGSRLRTHPLSAQLAWIDARSGEITPLGEPGIYPLVEPSPEGAHLLVARALPPYAGAPSAAGLRQSVEIWDGNARRLRVVARLPAAATHEITPRAFSWRPAPSDALVWVEPVAQGLDAGHPDRVLMLAAPFAGVPIELMQTEHRFSGLQWVERSRLALIKEYHRGTRTVRSWLLEADAGRAPPRLLGAHPIGDRQAGNARALARTDGTGAPVLVRHRDAIFLRGERADTAAGGAVLERLRLDTLARRPVWQARGDGREAALQLLAPGAQTLLLRRESAHEPPHYLLQHLRDGARTPIEPIAQPQPAPTLRQRLLRYRRQDGVELSAVVYTPHGQPPAQPLPLLMWVYPRNVADPAGTASGRASAQRFPAPGGLSALRVLPALCGYAVLDAVAMPVTGDDGNDTFVAQVRDGARAAIEAAAAAGIADPARVAVAGHSYGAFLVANLLAHTELFRAGVAMSGAYNRTLTPFGFQTERRSLWQAPETYLALSPFMYADRIRAPLLLVHGERDERPGTPASQSRRLFAAIDHHGGTARLVILPHEGHVYRARESMLHVAAELIDWLERHLGGTPATTPACAAAATGRAGLAAADGPEAAPRAGHTGSVGTGGLARATTTPESAIALPARPNDELALHARRGELHLFSAETGLRLEP